jgi:hypothetical protein
MAEETHGPSGAHANVHCSTFANHQEGDRNLVIKRTLCNSLHADDPGSLKATLV